MLTKDGNELILVLCDFTDEAKNAMEHATGVAKAGNDEVRLLHILNKESLAKFKKEGGETWIRTELARWAEENERKFGVKTTWHAEEGSIFTTVGEYAKQSGANLAVLGTHGVRGIQHVVGAFAMKVILSCPVPVIVVQNRKMSEHKSYDNIVIPIDSSRFGKNKLGYAIAIAKYFNSKVYLYSDFSSDEGEDKRYQLNLAQAKKLVESNGIEVATENHRGKAGNFSRGFIKFAVSVDADLMVISSHPDTVTIGNIIFGSTETDIINNDAQIPVMCVDPLQDASHVFGHIIFG